MPENPSDTPASGTDEPQPVADPALAPPPPAPTGSPAVATTRLRDRVFRFRSVVAVAAAGVIVGGVAGAGLTAVAGDGHDGRRSQLGRHGFGAGQMPGMPGAGMPGMPGGPGGLPGQGFPGQQEQQGGQVPGQVPGGVPGSAAG